MKNFTFQNPTKLIFGKGSVAKLTGEIPLESRILITFGGGSVKKHGLYQELVEALKEHTYFEFWGIEPNPTVETLREAIALGREKECDFVLAVGGGSVIDGSKLIAAAIPYQGDAWELVMKRVYHSQETLPLGTILTLPATGSEMNSGAVISNRELKEKHAFYSNHPLFSILDPEKGFTLPPFQLACGLADTFIHAIEQYLTTPGQSPLMDRWAEGILQTIVEIAPQIMEEPTNYQNMATFMLSATMALNGFISMGVTQDWSTHMIGHELTALHGLTHGHTLVITLPGTMWVMREEKGEKILQYGERIFGIKLKGESPQEREETIKAIIERTEQFFISLGFKIKLSENGIGMESIEEIERRFNERESKLGENGTVDGAVAKKILQYVL